MDDALDNPGAWLAGVDPFCALAPEQLGQLARHLQPCRHDAGERIYAAGQRLDGLYLLVAGEVGIEDAVGGVVSHLGAHDVFGERGLLRDGRAASTARALSPVQLWLLPAAVFAQLLREEVVVAEAFAVHVRPHDEADQPPAPDPALQAEADAATGIDDLARLTARIPGMLADAVEAGESHVLVTHRITRVADLVTRRLLALGEDRLGPAPAPWAWVACGSQGRREQAGVSDQDNALLLDDSVDARDRAWFEALARFVCDGLDAVGYMHCPGGMMAMNPRWCQPVSTWQAYFSGWIDAPDPMARMLASVMFDLRAVAGRASLLEALQAPTLARARRNDIFLAHMIANALEHGPALGLLRGLATIRSGEHRDHIDMKLAGVIPIVDLGRIYALQGGIAAVATRTRLVAARQRGLTSPSGGQELEAAYDRIATFRLLHQAAQVRRGQRPDNYLDPRGLTLAQRRQLRDAFVVVRTMQSALGHARSAFR